MTTVLRKLLTERHIESHTDFLAAYDRRAAQLDPPVPAGHGPSKTQFYQWLSGSLVGLPRSYHCRVLAEMFPGWTIEELFRSPEDATAAGTAHEPSLAATDSELSAFLGAEIIAHGITLVYPTFDFRWQSPKAHGDAEHADHSRLRGEASASVADHRPAARAAVPENEARGLLYLASVLHHRTNMSIHIRSDRDVVANGDRPCVSFGFTCNDCTQMYLENVEHPLFAIHSNAAGSPAAQLELANGIRYGLSWDHNIGVIARVRPNPDLHPDRYWIFCAGWGPRGTTGASWYLAHRWGVLHRRAGDREFVAVVDVGDNADDTARVEHLMIDSAS
ncbi:hypothetical protein [Nocardia nova]|uniref:hypothetical protein n=1 Tax=Nocardia nova TaxID=37330 RepID=UPI001895AB7F|nr:hypothetical protein [Nocardia nova]MBF6150244.1 hypothetical protein [Nocardia nova]